MADRHDPEAMKKNLRWLNLGMLLIFVFLAALPAVLNSFDRPAGRLVYGAFVAAFVGLCIALRGFL